MKDQMLLMLDFHAQFLAGHFVLPLQWHTHKPNNSVCESSDVCLQLLLWVQILLTLMVSAKRAENEKS